MAMTKTSTPNMENEPGSANAVSSNYTLQDSRHPYNSHFVQAMKGIEGMPLAGMETSVSEKDVAASLVKAGFDANFKKELPLQVLAGKHEGTLFAVQGEGGPAASRALIFTYEVQPNTFKEASESLNKQANHSIAMQAPDEKVQGRGQGFN
jgi:hypothetical protein